MCGLTSEVVSDPVVIGQVGTRDDHRSHQCLRRIKMTGQVAGAREKAPSAANPVESERSNAMEYHLLVEDAEVEV